MTIKTGAWGATAGKDFYDVYFHTKVEAEQYVSDRVGPDDRAEGYGLVEYLPHIVPTQALRDGLLYDIYRSFTSTWIRFAKGELGSKVFDEGIFLFNCGREHLFPSSNDDSLPMEVTWVEEEETETESARVDPSSVSPGTVAKFRSFMELLTFASDDCRVYFREDTLPEAALAEEVA